MNKDKEILRKLAHEVMEIANKPVQKERRELWRKLNSLKMQKPMINVNGFMWWQELYPDSQLSCTNEVCKEVEKYFLQCKLHDEIKDDTVIEPWVVLKSVYGKPYINTPEMGDSYWCENVWGVTFKRKTNPDRQGSWSFMPVIKELDDVKKLVAPMHIIDEEKTNERVATIEEAIGDIMPVIADRGPMVRNYCGSVIPDLCLLRGLEDVLYDIYDNTDWLKDVIRFMVDGVKNLHAQAEEKGDLRLINHFNQTMTYCEELKDVSCAKTPVKRNELWNFFETQEFTTISPEQYYEFAVKYHMEMAKEYALVAYGCCEDLTDKIKYLKKIDNLRIIAVTPWANAKKCAEQIGKDYVASWRPNPANTICRGFDEDFVRAALTQGLEDTKGCNVEINLKDVFTIKQDINALKSWVKVAREVVDKYIL